MWATKSLEEYRNSRASVNSVILSGLFLVLNLGGNDNIHIMHPYKNCESSVKFCL